MHSEKPMFDTEEGVNYGKCLSCGIDVETAEQGRQHQLETLNESEEANRKSHSIRILNMPREARIKSKIMDMVGDALDNLNIDLEDLVNDGHLTEDEITEALRGCDSPSDSWDIYKQESEEWKDD